MDMNVEPHAISAIAIAAPISRQIWDAKYRLKHADGAPIDLTIEDSWRRVARALAAVEAEPGQWEQPFYEALQDFRFLPAGRILSGAGTDRRVTLFNCFVMGDIADDLGSIFDHLREAALTMQQGGGIGYDFSTLRPKGAPVRGVGADASGPLSFMDVWDAMCRTIMSAGARRGAMMATMRCDHPDIEDFIAAKRQAGRLRNFNLVGKTELTKALAEFLFDDESAITRLDMSEYMEKHAVSRMIGAPPGYVGYDEGGALTESIRRRPYQVVLFDEVEKAHPDVFNVLLQVLDDGRLTDGQGRTVDFRNTLIIMTSNLGAEYLAAQVEGDHVDLVRPMVMDAVRRHFRPEFLNRIDEVILFQRLGRAQMDSIVTIQLQRLEARLADRRMAISLDATALHWLGEHGYDPVYGARPLKRVIQKELVDPIARKLLAGDLTEGSVIDVHAGDGKLSIARATLQ